MTSTIAVDNVSPAAGGTTRNLPKGVAAAWANLNGTGTIALRDSENIASVVDNGTGDYTFNFTNDMSDGSYSVGGFGSRGTSTSSNVTVFGQTDGHLVGSIAIVTTDLSTATDCAYVTFNLFGSLA